jgi:hypothetical protein
MLAAAQEPTPKPAPVPHRLAARPHHRVRDATHQTHIAAAVHLSNTAQLLNDAVVRDGLADQ